jgi:hypothetical protein
MLQRLSSRLRLCLQLGLLLLVVMRQSMPLAQSLMRSSSLQVMLQQMMVMVRLGVGVLARSCQQHCELASSKGASSKLPMTAVVRLPKQLQQQQRQRQSLPQRSLQQ